MIYICYGPTKSASTFLYQLVERIFEAANRQPLLLGPPFKPRLRVTNYFDDITPQLLHEISAAAGHRDVVLKTHQRAHPEVAELIEKGSIMACASIRDPREIALSMLDHGRRARKEGFAEFSEFHELRDTLESLDFQIDSFRSWAKIGGVKVFTFNEICFETSAVAEAIAQQVGVAVDVATVLKRFRNRGEIGEFNLGAALRYTEMTPEEQSLFLERYSSIYQDYRFDTPAAVQASLEPAGQTRRMRGEFAHRITYYRRLLRKILTGAYW